jgi:carbamoyltransferase
VHVDGTSRVQFVEPSVLPKYHRLLEEFEKLTGVPVLLNTSFNVKGEPIVCTIHDALRTFWSTGMEVLVAGDFIVRKPRAASA